MSDSSPAAPPLAPAWIALTHRLAAASGSASALVALVVGAPVHVACLRGALAWGGVLAVGRASGWLLERTGRSSDEEAGVAPGEGAAEEGR